MSQVATEQVLVIPTAVFHRLGHFQGFSADVSRYLGELFEPRHVSFRPRAEVEEDPSFKQLIPYVVMRHTDAAGVARLFSYTRGGGQGESRLRHKRSVGVGGHISTVDVLGGADPYREGMRRELEEEVIVRSPYVDRCAGLINDDETPVGKVHLGVVHVWDLERPEVDPREDDIALAGFRPLSELLADLDQFESWSQICLTALADGAAPA